MKTIIAFAGSNSKTSINKQLVTYAVTLMPEYNIDLLDLNDFELPVYSIDLEHEKGIPSAANDFFDLIKESDGIVLSLAEHNGAYSTAFKNLFDWMSRIESKTFLGKPMLLMASSPGGRGGQSVLAIAQDRFPRHDANIVGLFSLPSFGQNFLDGKIVDASLNNNLKEEIDNFKGSL